MPTDEGPEATVVIAALDAAGTIGAQLDALRRQRGEVRFEVVVADNGSVDATAEVARRQPGLEVVVVDASDRPGAGHARNVGAAHARGEVLAFCDADDEVEPGWLAALVPAAGEHGLATGPLLLRDGTPRTEVERPFGFWPTAPTANLAVRRDLFERLGGFTTDYHGAGGEDADLCWRAHLAGAELAWVPEARVAYRLRAGRRAQLRRVWHYEQCNVRLYRQYRVHGMGRETVPQVLRQLAWYLRRPIRTARRAARRQQLLRFLVVHASRAVGSARHRVLFP